MVRPVQQQQLIVSNTLVPPIVSAPNFPTIQQVLLGAASRAADQPVSAAAATASTVAAVVPDPAIVKTMLACKLARNLTHQQSDVNCLSVAATSSASLSSLVPSSSSSASVSSATKSGSLPVMSAAGTLSATEGNYITASSVLPSAGQVEDSDNKTVSSKKPESTTESNGLTPADAAVTTASSGSNAASLCLANGHAKSFHHDPSALVNGICSPTPSCSSEDQEPLRDVKVPKSPRYGSKCDEVVVNGDIVDDVNDDNNGDNGGGSDLDDCEGDMLVKAMMQADIIDCGGRPAVTDNSCDDDSHLSTDFLSEYIESTAGEQVSSGLNTAADQSSGAGTAGDAGFDSETAAAVADLLHETGMMTDDDAAAVSNMSVGGEDNCLSYEDSSAKTVPAEECVIPATCDKASSLRTDDEAQLSANVDDSSAAVAGEQLDCQFDTTDVTQPTHSDVRMEPPELVVGMGSTATAGLEVTTSVCSANTTGVGLLQSSSSSIPTQQQQQPISSVLTAAQLQNGMMVVPPHGISLPSGQFISGGTRLLIRPITSAAGSAPSFPVRLTQPTLAAAIEPSLSAQSGGTEASTGCSSSVVDGSLQLPASNVPTSAQTGIRFVSTTSQGQLIIQRAQILSTANSPLIQRVLVPQRPVASRSDGQMVLQAAQPNQQIGGQPLLLTRGPFAAAGQLRVAGPAGVQLGTSSQTQPSTPAQIVLQSGHVISVQPQQQQPSTHDVTLANSGQLTVAAASKLPILAAKPSSDQQQNQSALLSQTTDDAAQYMSSQPAMQGGAQLSTSVKPSLRPLMSTSQQPVQIVGGSMQLRTGLVGLPAGAGNASVILQHGGRPILLQSPNIGAAQHPSSYVVFRPSPLAASSAQEHLNGVALSTAALAGSSSQSLGPDMQSRKRPLAPLSATVTRSMRKKAKKDEDSGLSFMCEWSGCQR